MMPVYPGCILPIEAGQPSISRPGILSPASFGVLSTEQLTTERLTPHFRPAVLSSLPIDSTAANPLR